MEFIKKHSLIAGLALMFALTWPFYESLGLFVGYGLSVAALIVTRLTAGSQGVRSLLRRFLIWRVGFGWYLVVLLLPAVLYLAALGLHRLLGGPPVDMGATEARRIFGNSATIWLFLLPFFLTDAVTNGEELAWRGFLLPRLQSRVGALASSVLLGFVWGLWHLPRLWPVNAPWPIVYVLLHNIALAVLFTWLYDRTRGSLLMATLFHAAFNTAYVFLPVSPASGGGLSMQVTALAVECVAAICAAGTRSWRELRQRPPEGLPLSPRSR